MKSASITKNGQIANRAERAFAASIDAQGKTWIFQPKTFRLPSGHRYRPDFYVVEDRCFYEIVATRQAYSFQREKIAAFKLAFPRLRLRVVNQGAWKNGAGEPRVASVKQHRPYRRLTKTQILERLTACGGRPARLAELMRARNITTVAQFARVVGITRDRLYTPTARTLREIEALLAEAEARQAEPVSA